MNKSLGSTLRYGLACVILFVIAQLSPLRFTDKFYQFDRAHVFLPAFYASLLLIGVLIHSYTAVTWGRVLLKGALSGLLAGFVAQIVAVLVNRHGLGLFVTAPMTETIGSMLFATVVFLTPVWGLLSASITYALKGMKRSANL